MHLISLYLRGFRSYKDAFFEFDPKLNFIIGENGLGKTNLVEAIYYFMLGRSFRVQQPAELIHQDENSFYLELNFYKHEMNQTLKAHFDGKTRKIHLNGNILSSITALLGILIGVLHSPDDISLVKGTPAVRRQFIDYQLAQIDPIYLNQLKRYQRALQQRNVLLKNEELSTIESWEHELAQAAAYIINQRRMLLSQLNQLVQRNYQHLTKESEPIELCYLNFSPLDCDAAQLADHYRELLVKKRPFEIKRGYTLTGPHRDDFSILFQQKDLRLRASEGQKQSAVTALRLAEWELLKQKSDVTPLLMIDDVGLAVDEKRKNNLFNFLTQCGQLFLTSTLFNPSPLLPLPHKLISI